MQYIKTIRLYCLILLLVVNTLLYGAPSQTLSPYSIAELESLEKEFIQQINLSNSVERNPLASQYINHLGKKLARFASIPTPYFFLVKSPEINAFAGPGGYIGLNSQLIITTANESELAAVMAHEIAHVRLHHLYSMIEHQKQMRIPMLASLLASAALGVINPSAGLGAMMASASGFSQESISFTRTKEKEADRIGIDMLTRAGFNPRGMTAFFKKMQENTRYYYSANAIPAILRSHPLDVDRIAEAENRIPATTPKYGSSSLDYALFKEIIRTQTAADPHALLDFYVHLCPKQNPIVACNYGQALSLLLSNKFAAAETILNMLNSQYPNNPYFQIASAQAEVGLDHFDSALTSLAGLHQKDPENYAVLMAYGQALMAANQANKASQILLKGSREYPKDLPLCLALAQSQSQSQQKAYAYFTQAQCLLLTGEAHAAIAQLKVAQNIAAKDNYLLARIAAKIDEIRYMADIPKPR